VLGQHGRRPDEALVRFPDDLLGLALVVVLSQHVLDRLEPGPLLIVALDHRPRRLLAVGVVEHRLLGIGVGVHLSSDSMSIGLSFHCRTGSTRRMMNRVRCSERVTENQNFVRCSPERTSMRSNSGASRMNSLYSVSVQKPITRSTPARLYQERSNMTISPAAGRCGT